MRKAESSNPKEKDVPSFEGPRHRPHWLAAFTCLVVGILLSVALLDYEPGQSIQNTTNPTSVNLVGVIGAEFTFWSYNLLGASTWLLPIFLFWMTYIYLRSARSLTGTRLFAMACCIAAFSPLMAMQLTVFTSKDLFTAGPGGQLGAFIYLTVLKDSIGVFGSALILGTIYLVGMLFIFTRDIAAEIARLMNNFTEWRQKRAALRAARLDEMRKQREDAAKAKLAAATAATTSTAPILHAGTSKKMVVPKGEDPLAETAKAGTAPPMKAAPEPVVPAKPAAPAKATATKPATESKPATDTKPLAVAAGKIELNIVKPEETKKAKVTLPQSDDKDYEFPPLKLLREQVKSESNSEEEHRQNAENLLRILSEFGVEVTLGEIHVGPVITRYEVVPAAGVRVEKISGLDKNIALGMRAQSVRILAPIPGKAAVGVEVPNQKSTPVGMREILESEDWVGAKAEIPIALGKDVSGKPLVSDLTKMPHLLIAGATGSGKSVCINSIVASILYSKSPKDLRLIMVDPKVVELKVFNSLPHMLIPVVTEPKKVPGALKWLLSEMEQRYQIFAKVNVRNIVGFNNRKKDPKGAEFPPAEQQAELEGVTEEIEIPDRLPYIVAIIDELADLMMVNPAEIETSIARLAQLARAAGIHLIIATQRPSVNVITGVIKANLPSRIAFQVASQVDSRTILDTKGADTLIGRGDMLFSPPGSSRLVRAQGAFVADEEVMDLVEFLKRNGPPQYAQSVQQQIDRAAKEDDEDGDDVGDDEDMGDDGELFAQAYDVLKSTRRASTSMMQRRLRIGYNRAARIMDLMEQKGIVGPENGSSPREILVDLDTYQP
ncbi:MAG TPA: DNA translocase FtsK 4TM domain-containing protein [Lacunisphaera sp.]|nr:DNA translocase FtsK 4TM domain-containing protein [Lacunisphaera sp.]